MNSNINTSRRQFTFNLLKLSAIAGLAVSTPLLLAHKVIKRSNLNAPDKNGISLLDGFSSKVVATEGLPAANNSSYLWHERPDGGAVFTDMSEKNIGGWIYVSNQESNDSLGGVGALKFNSQAEVIDAYRILDGTTRNCAGGTTPWGTWLSAEEWGGGLVWECDPTGQYQARALPICGTFKHEAAIIDPINEVIYLTEDRPDGCLYRVLLDNYPSLDSGQLQVAEITGELDTNRAQLNWHDISEPNPTAEQTQTRYQVSQSTEFKGGEGLWYFDGDIYFSTKLDNRIWKLNAGSQNLEVIYDIETSNTPVLSGVDNLTVDQSGYVYVAEDGGDMQVVMLSDTGLVLPILQINNQDFSEITGVAFTPDSSRMYLSSQRGPSTNGNLGITYEISGPFDQLDIIFKNDFE